MVTLTVKFIKFYRPSRRQVFILLFTYPKYEIKFIKMQHMELYFSHQI